VGPGNGDGSAKSAVYELTAPTSPLRWPLDTPLYYMSMGIAEYSRANWASVGQLKTLTTIVLPLPAQLVDVQQVAFPEKEIGQGGRGILAGAGYLRGQNQINAKDLGGGLVGAASTEAVHVADTAMKAAVGNRLAPDLAATLSAAGAAINNFLTVRLDGLRYMRHRFSWTMSPRNAAESRAIGAIVVALKNAQAPSVHVGSSFFTWPQIFQLQFKNQLGVDMGVRLFGFKPAVLESAVFNYAPGATPAFFGDTRYPEGVTVQLDFLELELWLRGSYKVDSDVSGELQDAVKAASADTTSDALVNSLNNLVNHKFTSK